MPDSKHEGIRKISRFREHVMQQVTAECDEITRNVEEFRQQELAPSNSIVKRNSDKKLIESKQRTNLECQREIAAKKQELRAEYSAKREELRELVFNLVRKKLTELTKSDKYLAWLKSKAEPYRLLDVHVRPCDVETLKGLKNVQADDSVTKLGGFIAVSDGYEVDETFERLLSEQEEWFISNSGLERE